jgi:hypothetical protein
VTRMSLAFRRQPRMMMPPLTMGVTMYRTLLLSASLFVSTAAAAQSPAPADLALGRDIAGKLLPDGTYEKMMGGMMGKMMGGMTDQMTAMPIAPYLKLAGLPESDIAKLGQTTIKQIMEIVDPAYEQRMHIIMPTMMEEMGKVMTQFEPQMREGLAQAYATHFTPAQLTDIDHFFNTPSGAAFASQNMTIAADPAVMEKMQAFMPQLMQAMPGIMQKAQAATAGLPKPKTPATLTDADRAKLAQLLGVSPDKLKKAPTS